MRRELAVAREAETSGDLAQVAGLAVGAEPRQCGAEALLRQITVERVPGPPAEDPAGVEGGDADHPHDRRDGPGLPAEGQAGVTGTPETGRNVTSMFYVLAIVP